MRGYGAPSNETATENLTNPDWGWGDVPPSSWDSSTSDYGWGSHRSFAFTPYLLSTENIADDGGYRIEIVGNFPRLGASTNQRPRGYSVILSKNGVDYLCNSGRAGESTCTTNLPATRLTGFSPVLDVGTYTVSFKYQNNTITVGTIETVRRMRTTSEYMLRSALPSRFDSGARLLELEPILDSNAVSARTETQSNLSYLLRAVGQSIAEFSQTSLITRLTIDFNPIDLTLYVESTLGMPSSGAVIIDGLRFHYSSKTNTALDGITRPQGQLKTIARGERVEHDTHIFTD